MKKTRKRKRLIPGLRGLRRRLPGRRVTQPVAVSPPAPEPVNVLPGVRPRTRVEPPTQVDYSLDIQRLGDAVLALGDRLDVQTKKKVLPVQTDYNPDIQRLEDAVLALGDRVDQVARRGG